MTWIFVWNTAEIAGCHVIVEPGRFPLKMSAKPADPDAAPMSAAATAANARLTFEELSQLNERKLELKRQHNGYMEKHPDWVLVQLDIKNTISTPVHSQRRQRGQDLNSCVIVAVVRVAAIGIVIVATFA